MSNGLGLMSSAYQKFYSALSSLDRFDIRNDLFDNISNLDNFFSEYRNITFVLQKSLSKTEFTQDYEKLREKYLNNPISSWMVDTRNAVLKKQPYELNKKIVVTIYSPESSQEILTQEFTLTNEIPYSLVESNIKEIISTYNSIETHFSIECIFYENSVEAIFNNIHESIITMFQFLRDMEKVINEEENIITNKIKEKIANLYFCKIPIEWLFIQDYVYYADLDKFEISIRATISYYKTNEIVRTLQRDERLPLSRLNRFHSKASQSLNDAFDAFLFLHLCIYQEPNQKVMPTFMIVYEDNTYISYSFLSSIKTTLYREINQIADKIEEGGIEAIFFTFESYVYDSESLDQFYLMSYPKRIEFSQTEKALFLMITKSSPLICCAFDQKRILDESYVNGQLDKFYNGNNQLTKSFFLPIEQAFSNKK